VVVSRLAIVLAVNIAEAIVYSLPGGAVEIELKLGRRPTETLELDGSAAT
jgi:hypothetical protein